jgi:hypothetical protein
LCVVKSVTPLSKLLFIVITVARLRQRAGNTPFQQMLKMWYKRI